MSGNVESNHSEPHEATPDDGIPLCTRCLAPHSPDDHYCQNCGAAVGQFTTYIPFVDIPFYANFYARLWERVWHERRVALHSRAFCVLLILLFAPVMLVGLPFVLLKRRNGHRTPTA